MLCFLWLAQLPRLASPSWPSHHSWSLSQCALQSLPDCVLLLLHDQVIIHEAYHSVHFSHLPDSHILIFQFQLIQFLDKLRKLHHGKFIVHLHQTIHGSCCFFMYKTFHSLLLLFDFAHKCASLAFHIPEKQSSVVCLGCRGLLLPLWLFLLSSPYCPLPVSFVILIVCFPGVLHSETEMHFLLLWLWFWFWLVLLCWLLRQYGAWIRVLQGAMSKSVLSHLGFVPIVPIRCCPDFSQLAGRWQADRTAYVALVLQPTACQCIHTSLPRFPPPPAGCWDFIYPSRWGWSKMRLLSSSTLAQSSA